METIIEILSKIGFDWRMALANLVNFLIIFWLLKRYAFAPIKKVLSERREKIDQGLEDAQKAQTELTMAKQTSEQELAHARQKAQEIIAQAHEQGKEMLVKAESDTQAKVDKLVSDARGVIAKEKQAMEADIEEKTVTIALEVSSKIIKEKLDEKKDKALIEGLLN